MQKTRESAERDRQTFLVDQTASLHESPFAPATARRKAAFAKWKFVERNPRSLDLDFTFVATKTDNRAAQRFRPDEDEFYRVEHLPCGTSIGRFIHVHHYVCAMKGNNRRLRPCANQRQQMHSDVTEVNMQKTRIGFF